MLEILTRFLRKSSANSSRKFSRKFSAGRTNHFRTIEPLEARTLLSASVPTGAVKVMNTTTISGWAYNKDDAAEAMNIEIAVNGQVEDLVANQFMAGLPGSVISAYHGFSFDLSSLESVLPPGPSTVSVVAISPSTGVEKVLKTGTITEPTPIGQVQKVTATEISGWAFEKGLSSPLEVRIDVDGVTGVPFTTNVVRNDLNKTYHVQNLGFDVTGDFAGHEIEVFAIDPRSGVAKLIYTNNKLPTGKVQVNDGFTVSGYASDPNSPGSPINIRVTVDGQTLSGTPTPANGANSVLPGHGFSVAIPGLTPGKHTINVYAIDGQASSAKEVLIGSKVVNDAPPVGKITTLNSSEIQGWALDPDLIASPTTVNLYVDNSFFASVQASDPVSSLTSKYGKAIGPNHGFTFDLSTLPPGSHSITVTAIDNRTSDENEVVIYDGFIDNQQPIGAISTINGTTITGWAYDPDAGTAPIEVDIYVDGVYATTTNANLAGSNVNATVPSPDHAFSVDLPTLGFGTHRIDAYAADFTGGQQGSTSVLIGTKTVVNNRPIGKLETASATTITGYAADPDELGQSVQIEVYINGVLALPTSPDSPIVANIERDDLLTQAPFSTVPGFSDYGFSITLPTLSPGANEVDVYAVDLNNGIISPIGSRIITV